MSMIFFIFSITIKTTIFREKKLVVFKFFNEVNLEH